MRRLKPIILFVLTLTIVWSLIRLVTIPELLAELVIKPVVWLGITAIFFYFKIIPQTVLRTIRTQFLTLTPVLKTILLPLLGMLAAAVLINFRGFSLPALSPEILLLALVTNFSTAIIEEAIFRGVLYVWLLKTTDELTAFLLVQAAFLMIHGVQLLTHSTSIAQFAVHAYVIVIFSVIHTAVFRLNKSLYSAILTHGVWNYINQLSLLAK